MIFEATSSCFKHRPRYPPLRKATCLPINQDSVSRGAREDASSVQGSRFQTFEDSQAEPVNEPQIAREILDLAAQHVKPGITTDEIDEIVHQATIERGAYPSPLNYRNFPKSVCT